ncbi:MAG: hypothetical protein R3B47_21465 [Bacteroidia bacterium]
MMPNKSKQTTAVSLYVNNLLAWISFAIPNTASSPSRLEMIVISSWNLVNISAANTIDRLPAIFITFPHVSFRAKYVAN